MLKKIKFLALVTMFWAALSTTAQVTTSAMPGVVTDENLKAMIVDTIIDLHTPSAMLHNAVPQPDVSSGDGIGTFSGMFFGILSLCVFAILKGKDVKLKISPLCFSMDLFSKEEKKSNKNKKKNKKKKKKNREGSVLR